MVLAALGARAEMMNARVRFEPSDDVRLSERSACLATEIRQDSGDWLVIEPGEFTVFQPSNEKSDVSAASGSVSGQTVTWMKELGWSFALKEAGTYDVWMRARFPLAANYNHSERMDEGVAATVSDSADGRRVDKFAGTSMFTVQDAWLEPGHWHWFKSKSYELAAGRHFFHWPANGAWNGGCELDRLVLVRRSSDVEAESAGLENRTVVRAKTGTLVSRRIRIGSVKAWTFEAVLKPGDGQVAIEYAYRADDWRPLAIGEVQAVPSGAEYLYLRIRLTAAEKGLQPRVDNFRFRVDKTGVPDAAKPAQKADVKSKEGEKTMTNKIKTMAAAACVAATGFAALPQLEPAFSAAQVEKGAPKLEWTKNADGSESTVLTEKVAGLDLAGVKLTRSHSGDGVRAEVVYALENVTKELRYASFGWRTSFSIKDGNDRNWFPTTDNVLDLTAQSSLWGYYTKPGPWFFSLVEPWFAAYNPGHKTGYAFLFDFNTLSAAYGANDMKTRGVLFDGGMLPPGAKLTVKTVVRELKGLSSLATVNDDFAAGFSGPASAPALEVRAFRDLALEGQARQADVNGKELGMAEVKATLKAGEARNVCVIKSAKPETQTVLSAVLSTPIPQDYTYSFESLRENGFRMASLPMVPAIWTHHRALPPKQLPETAAVRQVAQDKALLLFGFYANFFRFPEMFPELKFTTVPAVPQGIANVPPASTIGEYKYVFMGDVNEESVRPMMARLAAYVKNGGTLVVGGGPFAYGCGGYEGTFLETMLPVKTRKFDCLPACASDKDGLTPVKFDETDSTLFWVQRDAVKDGAEVLLRTTAGDPLLVKGAYGKGRVFAFLATPLGDEATDAKAFWTNPAYLELLRSKLK